MLLDPRRPTLTLRDDDPQLLDKMATSILAGDASEELRLIVLEWNELRRIRFRELRHEPKGKLDLRIEKALQDMATQLYLYIVVELDQNTTPIERVHLSVNPWEPRLDHIKPYELPHATFRKNDAWRLIWTLETATREMALGDLRDWKPRRFGLRKFLLNQNATLRLEFDQMKELVELEHKTTARMTR